MSKIRKPAVLALCLVAILTVRAPATVISESTGSFTYTYHSGTDVADPNPVLTNAGFNVETLGNGNAAYFDTSTAPGTADVVYTFQAAAGNIFSGNITTQELTLVAFNQGGSVTETVTPNNASASPVTLITAPDNNFDYYSTPASFNVNGATSFTIDYTLYNPSNNSILTQLFRETNGTTSSPFTVTGLVVPAPEPSSMGLCLLGAAGLWLAARKRKARS